MFYIIIVDDWEHFLHIIYWFYQETFIGTFVYYCVGLFQYGGHWPCSRSIPPQCKVVKFLNFDERCDQLTLDWERCFLHQIKIWNLYIFMIQTFFRYFAFLSFWWTLTSVLRIFCCGAPILKIRIPGLSKFIHLSRDQISWIFNNNK